MAIFSHESCVFVVMSLVKKWLILFIVGTVIMYHGLLLHVTYNLTLWQLFHKFCVCCDIAEKNGFILFLCGRVINHSRGVMHVKYILALCQNVTCPLL